MSKQVQSENEHFIERNMKNWNTKVVFHFLKCDVMASYEPLRTFLWGITKYHVSK